MVKIFDRLKVRGICKRLEIPLERSRLLQQVHVITKRRGCGFFVLNTHETVEDKLEEFYPPPPLLYRLTESEWEVRAGIQKMLKDNSFRKEILDQYKEAIKPALPGYSLFQLVSSKY